MLTARYALSPYKTQIQLVFKGLRYPTKELTVSSRVLSYSDDRSCSEDVPTFDAIRNLVV